MAQELESLVARDCRGHQSWRKGLALLGLFRLKESAEDLKEAQEALGEACGLTW